MELIAGLQEKIVCLLIFDKQANIFLSQLKIELFSTEIYRNIVQVSIKFWREFNAPPLLNITDLLDNKIKDKEEKEAYYKTILSLYAIKDDINRDFVISNLASFIKQQELKRDIVEAFDCLQIGNLKGAEKILFEKKRSINSSFSEGVFPLHNPQELFNDEINLECIYLGIPYLDNLKICPTKKELFTLLARSSGGKSLFAVHIAKMATIQGKKVLYVTLELNEVRTSRRILQALFGIATVAEEVDNTTLLIKDDIGKFIDFTVVIPEVMDFKNAKLLESIQPALKHLNAKHLLVKEFPTGQLTIDGLKSYLDYLNYKIGFKPDVMLVDYPDLMYLDKDSLRVDLGRTYVDLRGIAVEREIAVVAVTQTNRVAEDVSLITRKHIAEDFSKIYITDNLLTYNQTQCEKTKGLARLYVDKGRNSKQGGVVLITQNYSLSQFCLDSVFMDPQVSDILENLT